MTGTITTTVDVVNQRIGVTLAGWVSPANGSVKVVRVHPDTTEWAVRGSAVGGTWTTSGGSGFAWDYEAPFLQTVTYAAMDGLTRVVSTSETLVIRSSWVTVPGLPAFDSLVRLSKVPRAISRARPQAVLQPIGRTTPVVLSDVLKSPSFTVSAITMSYAEANVLESVLENGATVLLQMPLTRWPWQYVAVSAVVENTVTEKLPFDPAAASDDTMSTWDFTCVVVDPPVGGIFGDPTASYAVIVSTYATYTALKTAKATYLLVVKGV